MTSPQTKKPAAPVQEIGYAHAPQYNWWEYSDETTPELQWPQSISVYDHMRRTDSQVTSVLRAMTLPVRRTPWRIDPNGASDEVTEFVADNLGLPVVGAGERTPPRQKDRFSWQEHLRQALLMLTFGHMFFEVTYRVDEAGDRAHLRKLGPRMPKTIEKIDVAEDGGLVSISQYWTRTDRRPQPIPVDRLVAYVHEREAGNWLGQSILRPAYKNALLKDRLLRVQAQTIERNGMGIPLYTGADGEVSLTTGLGMARAWRAGESAGTAIPFGAQMTLVGVSGTLPDAEPAIRYHDEQIGRAVLAHFLNLGTQTGSWALGTTFADFFTMSLQTLAEQIADTASQHIVEDLVDVNWGPDEPSPRIIFDEIGSRQPATAQSLVALFGAGALTPDDRLEESLRQQYGLPPKQPQFLVDQPGDGPAPPPDVEAIEVQASAHIDVDDDDEPGQFDEDTAALIAALADFTGEVWASDPDWDPDEHLRGPGGRFRNMFAKIQRALADWDGGKGPDDPLKEFQRREPLMDAAKKRGVKLKRGATRDEIVEALKDDIRAKRAAARGEEAPPKPTHRLTLSSKRYRDQDAGVYREANGKVSLYRESSTGQRGSRIASFDDLAGLEQWGRDNDEPQVADWAASERGVKPAKRAPAKKAAAPAVSPEQAREVEVENRIRAAYREIAARPFTRTSNVDLRPEWVRMADLREHPAIAELPRAEQDRVLKKLVIEGGNAIPESAQWLLRPEDRAGALPMGGQQKHWLQLDDPSDRPLPGASERAPVKKAAPRKAPAKKATPADRYELAPGLKGPLGKRRHAEREAALMDIVEVGSLSVIQSPDMIEILESLRANGYVHEDGKKWRLTDKGRAYVRARREPAAPPAKATPRKAAKSAPASLDPDNPDLGSDRMSQDIMGLLSAGWTPDEIVEEMPEIAEPQARAYVAEVAALMKARGDLSGGAEIHPALARLIKDGRPPLPGQVSSPLSAPPATLSVRDVVGELGFDLDWAPKSGPRDFGDYREHIGSHDASMLASVQSALDGEAAPELGVHRPGASYAAIGRGLEKWANGSVGPYYNAAHADQGTGGRPEAAAAYRAQGDRWVALAQKLQAMRRDPGARPAPTPRAPKAERAPRQPRAAREPGAGLSPVPASTLARISTGLGAARSSDDARRVIDDEKLTKGQLRQLAQDLDVPLVGGSTATQIRDDIVKVKVSGRLMTAVIHDALAPAPAKATPKPKREPLGDPAAKLSSLRALGDREAARDELDLLLLDDLKTLAREAGVATSGRKPDVADRIAERIQFSSAPRQSAGAPRPAVAELTPERKVEIEGAIRQAYAPAGGHGYMNLADLRARLGDRHPREHVDQILRELNRTPGVDVVPNSNQKTLTAEDREAAVLIGNQPKHWIKIARGPAAPGPDQSSRPTTPTAVRPSGLPTDRKPESGDFDDLADRITMLQPKTREAILEILQDLSAPELGRLARKIQGDVMFVPGANKVSSRRRGLKIPAELSLNEKRRWLAEKLSARTFVWR